MLCDVFFSFFFFYIFATHHFKSNQFLLSSSISIIPRKEEPMLKIKTNWILNRRAISVAWCIQRRNEHPKNKSISPTLNIFNLKCSPIQNIAYLPWNGIWYFDFIPFTYWKRFANDIYWGHGEWEHERIEEVDKSMRLHNIKTGISFRNMDNKPMRHIHTAKRQKKKTKKKMNFIPIENFATTKSMHQPS